MGGLDGRRVIVTGGAGGIGGAAVRALVERGARVACTVHESTAAVPDGVATARCDIASRASVDATVDGLVAGLGGLDALVHAAGIHGSCPAAELTEDAWDRMFALNAKATVFTNQAAFGHLRDSGGSIVNMGSIEGVRGTPGNAAYSSSRAAVMAWSRSVAQEWARHGIRVNCVAPVVETPLSNRLRDSYDDAGRAAMDARLRQAIPLGGKMGDPLRDLAPVLAFLVSDDARFITGQTLAVDGGMMMLGS